MELKDIIKLVLNLILIELLLPHNEVDKFYIKKGKIIKIKWIGGSISKLKKGKWILKE